MLDIEWQAKMNPDLYILIIKVVGSNYFQSSYELMLLNLIGFERS